MITRLHTALVLCAWVTGCVTSYNTPRSAPPPPPARPSAASATSSGSGSSAGRTSTNAPKAGHGPTRAAGDSADKRQREVKHLEVAIQGKSDSPLLGKVALKEVPGGVKVIVRVENIRPGKHGVHIHQFPNCGGKEALAAGGHFNPDDSPHALPSKEKRHLGDLGNLVVKAPERTGRLEIVVPDANLVVGAPRSFVNRSLVVHAEPDDGKRQPAGSSGKRIGCAELTIAAAKASPTGKLVLAP